MVAQLKSDTELYTVEAYLELDRNAPEGVKYEYAGGLVYMMTGASPEHNLIAMNIGTLLNAQLRDSPCLVLSSDQRIRVEASDESTFRYADVTVVCDDPRYSEDRPASLLNPTVIVEVLSETTEFKDRTDKLAEYRSIPSLQAYLLVSQTKPQVEYYLRDTERSAWLYDDVTALDGAFDLETLGCTVELSVVYRKVDFDRETPEDVVADAD
jgi:Uma2 family endonuclease